MTVCSVDGCDNTATRRGWCKKHYMRWKRHGDPTITLRLWGTLDERLLAYTDASDGPDACWPWTRARTEHGYGIVTKDDGGTALAHRATYIAIHGQLDPSIDVMHLCNNEACCNPLHLQAGTRAENQRYMAETGQSASGERNGQAKLTDKQVAELRALRAAGWKIVPLAERFDISIAHVSRICTHRRRG